MINRCKYNKNELWFQGVYNNLNDKCFKCAKKIDINLHVMIICLNCEILLDSYCTYPTVCPECVKCKKILRGKVFGSKCPCCEDERMHIAITSYS